MPSPDPARRHLAACLALAAAMPARFAQAAPDPSRFPAHPVKLIVPYAPGGTHDTIARLYGQQMTELLKQPVVVDNRPGAGGTVAAGVAAKAPADGYTVFVGDVGANAIAASLYPTLGYDPVRDFAPLTLAATHPTLIAVNPALPVRSMQELLALAKAKPGSLAYGTVGIGSVSHMAMELLKTVTGAGMMHVPYKGGPAMLTAAAGGEVQVAPTSLQSALPFIASGKLRPLAQMGAQRSPLLPEVPTLAELGIRGVIVETWAGFLVPAATPPAVAEQLQRAFVRAGRSDEVGSKLRAMGWEPVNGTPEEFRRFLASETEKYAKVVRAANIKPE